MLLLSDFMVKNFDIKQTLMSMYITSQIEVMSMCHRVINRLQTQFKIMSFILCNLRDIMIFTDKINEIFFVLFFFLTTNTLHGSEILIDIC